MATPRRNDHPLSMRIPAADIAIIDRAARARGHSRTAFVREAAVRAAEQVVMEETLIKLGARDFVAFMAEIDTPAEPVPEMVELFRRKAPWES